MGPMGTELMMDTVKPFNGNAVQFLVPKAAPKSSTLPGDGSTEEGVNKNAMPNAWQSSSASSNSAASAISAGTGTTAVPQNQNERLRDLLDENICFKAVIVPSEGYRQTQSPRSTSPRSAASSGSTSPSSDSANYGFLLRAGMGLTLDTYQPRVDIRTRISKKAYELLQKRIKYALTGVKEIVPTAVVPTVTATTPTATPTNGKEGGAVTGTIPPPPPGPPPSDNIPLVDINLLSVGIQELRQQLRGHTVQRSTPVNNPVASPSQPEASSNPVASPSQPESNSKPEGSNAEAKTSGSGTNPLKRKTCD